MNALGADLLARCRAALRTGDAAGARHCLEGADPNSGVVLELLARAHYLDLDFDAAISSWERAYAAHRETRDTLGAVRVARVLSYLYHSFVGDFAVSAGWIARARSLLQSDPAGPLSAEGGWVALNSGMFNDDRATKEAYFREALDIARRVAGPRRGGGQPRRDERLRQRCRGHDVTRGLLRARAHRSGHGGRGGTCSLGRW